MLEVSKNEDNKSKGNTGGIDPAIDTVLPV
jgi:hypothetical protein